MKTFKDYLEEKGRCWTGYKPVPGKKPYSDDSCKKVTENINHTYGKNEKQQHTHVANQDLHFGAGHVVKKGSTLRKVDGSSQMYVHLKDGKPVTKTHPILSLPKTHVTAINEDGMAGAPANSVGDGNIAGSGGAGGEPGVSKKRNPLMSFYKRKPPKM
jgi:hypothetical protein